jgi:ElaB/YqjD/DUF883 family membrane-anchored ribosome-binding protein
MATQTRSISQKSNGASPIDGVIHGAEALLAATADLGEEKLEDLRTTLHEDLEAARKQLGKLEARVAERATGIDDYVHENPWQVIGAAAVAGVIVGALGAIAARK